MNPIRKKSKVALFGLTGAILLMCLGCGGSQLSQDSNLSFNKNSLSASTDTSTPPTLVTDIPEGDTLAFSYNSKLFLATGKKVTIAPNLSAEVDSATLAPLSESIAALTTTPNGTQLLMSGQSDPSTASPSPIDSSGVLAWSPDGKLLASYNNTKQEIDILNANGSKQSTVKIKSSLAPSKILFSPALKSMVWLTSGPNPELMQYTFSDSKQQTLFQAKAGSTISGFGFASPSAIAIAMGSAQAGNIYELDLKSSHITNITQSDAGNLKYLATQFAIKPDKARIASYNLTHKSIEVFDGNGKLLNLLPCPDWLAANPKWSSTGNLYLNYGDPTVIQVVQKGLGSPKKLLPVLVGSSWSVN